MRLDRRSATLVGLVALLALLVAARLALPALIAGKLRGAAAERGLVASWRSLALPSPFRVELRGLALVDTARADSVLTADSVAVEVDPASLLTFHPRVARAALAHARVRLASRRGAEPDTLAPAEEEIAEVSPRALKQRRSAEQLARLLLAPARRLPELRVSDVTLETPADDEALLRGAHLAALTLVRERGGVRLGAAGVLGLEREVPFTVRLAYGRDDRISGRAVLGVPDSSGRPGETVRLGVDGALHQDRRGGVLRLADGTRVTVGELAFLLGGSLDARGPKLSVRLAADGITEEQVVRTVPREALGPLTGLAVNGSFDYRLALDLDLERPDSVDFEADVIPHDLRLDTAHTTLQLARIDQPFLAEIHLPHDRVVEREISLLNPFYRSLGELDSLLVHAVVTNEDGGFFHHRGFNTEAVKLAIAADVKAGAWRRGAGTITMQLARNLWLGHARTLSRKAQEVVMAWVLEHLTGIPKRRLLEIYLNIIEWGPEVQGAAEAANYYFAKDPGHLTVDECLFLTTIVPAPTRWRYRFNPDGTLREFEKAQMHFIGRAMVAKGWLDPAMLPDREALRVEIRGRARDVLFPPESSLDTPGEPGGP